MFSVIFDMDGTLLDTQRIGIPAWDYGGRLQGIENLGEHVFNVFGMNANGSSDYLRTHFPTLDVELFKRHAREFIERNGTVEFKKGAKEILAFLKEQNVKIALASGTSRPSVEHHLKAVNAEHFFDATVCGTEVQKGKPEPDVFLKAAKLIGANPADCFVFEDSENGVKAAKKAGMKVIGIPDVVPFKDETKQLLFAEHKDFFESIELLKRYL
jgi:HAD superfamily hydrolase (TIGR01509 family)